METLRKRPAACLILLCFMTITALAGNDQRIGGSGAPELLIPVGARGTALMGASLTSLSGVEAIYWNPAGLARMEHGVEAMFSHMQYIADIGIQYGAVGVQAGEFGNLGFTLKSISFGDIPVTTESSPDGTGELYSPTYINLGFTYSKLLTDRISVGVTTGLVSERIQSVSATGVAFNIGLQYNNLSIQGLNLAVVVKNVGPDMQFDGSNLLRQANASSGLRGNQLYKVQAATFSLPSSMEIGIGYQRKFDDQNSGMLGAMFRNNNSQDDEYGFGGEYAFNDLLFLRGGYIFAPQVAKDVTGESGYIYDYTLGAGVHYDVSGIDLSFDYTFRHVKYFDNNNIISIRVGF